VRARTDEPPTVAQGPLPVDLGTYVRQHPRYPVDWAARLELDGRRTDVRVLDVSFTGAAIEAFSDLRAGDRGTLRFEQLQGQPTLEVVVKNVVSSVRRIGVSFEAPGEISSRLVAAAAALAAATARERSGPLPAPALHIGLTRVNAAGDAGGDGPPRPRRLLAVRVARVARVPHADLWAGRWPRRGGQ